MIKVFERFSGVITKLRRPKRMWDQIHYFVPGIPRLMSGNFYGLKFYMELRGLLVPPPCADGVYFIGSATLAEPMMMGNSIVHGAVKLVGPSSIGREQCLAAAVKWLTAKQLADIKSGRLFAAIGVSGGDSQSIITIVVAVEINKP